MADPPAYLAALYLNYERYLDEEAREIKNIAGEIRAGRGRAGVLERLQSAIEHNSGYIRSVQQSLRALISVTDITRALGTAEALRYISPWEYLRRDWCRLPEGELEIEAIERFVVGTLEAHPASLSSVLVIGAGTGRLAWDLAQRAELLYAMDTSFTMVHQFHELLERNIVFFEINRNNVRTADETVRMHDAGAIPGESANPVYFVGDAVNVPLADRSLSAIVSVYFTDLIPISAYLEEIERLLVPGGLFVHFGPLEYRLPNACDCVSAEEIKSLFAAHSFTAIADGSVRTSHLSSTSSMHAMVYENWTFAAVNENRPAATRPVDVTWASVVAIASDIGYHASGVFSRDGERLVEAALVLSGGARYEGAISALDILRLVDGKKTNGEIVRLLAERYEVTEQSRDRVLEFIKTLVREHALHVVEGSRADGAAV